MDTVFLSRVQFGLTISFHYIFPPLSIGLGLMLVIMEGMYLKTQNMLYEHMTKFWIRVFALIFGLGVATGIVMEFEFGTNWANYSRFVGDVFGAPLASEGIFAFFLESGFLALLLFGWNRVGPKMHFVSTVMVALGSTFSALWINVANSWMQTPAGFKIKVQNGRPVGALITNFWQVVFNPSTMVRLEHVIVGAFLSGAFLVLSVGSWYVLKNQHKEIGRACVKIALVVAAICALLQLFVGDLNDRMIAKYQPIKLAAFEGHFNSQGSASLSLFGWVNQADQTTHSIAIPGLLSWLLYFDASHPVQGLDSTNPSNWPPVNPVFQSYHLMIAIGMLLILITLLGLFYWKRGTLFDQRWLLWIFVFSVVGPLAANELGWFSAEVGRQPWIVYGILKTSDGVSPNLPAADVLASTIMFSIMYLLLFALFIFLLDRKIKAGPVVAEPDETAEGSELLLGHARMDP
ncbi:MAG TPA: cytochrome ubiquinol oxidase subunit I [Phycisphaerae bacterium]|nr:cytochrome ubiquinol oxidase subunit I [Phycisphaerae bacterium]